MRRIASLRADLSFLEWLLRAQDAQAGTTDFVDGVRADLGSPCFPSTVSGITDACCGADLFLGPRLRSLTHISVFQQSRTHSALIAAFLQVTSQAKTYCCK